MKLLFDPDTSPYLLILLACLVSGLLAIGRSWLLRPPSPFPPRAQWALDGGIVVGLTWLMLHHLPRLHHLLNPRWFPGGQDYTDYLASTLWMLDPGLVEFCPFRYPFYPWLAAWACRLQSVSPAVGAMQVSLLASVLLPGALYLLARQLVPRAVAASAALLVIHQPEMIQSLATPYEYIVCTLLYTLALAAGLWAVSRGGFWRALLFGALSALVMASTAKSLAFLLPAAGVLALVVAWQLRLRQWKALSWLGSWLLPLAVMWLIFASYRPYFHSLEFMMFNVQAGDAEDYLGFRPKPPAGTGWKEPAPLSQLGYWRVGEARALWHLPQILQYLATGPEPMLPMSRRWPAFVEAIRAAVILPHPLWFLLGLGGLFLAGSWPRGRPLPLAGRLWASLLLGGCVALQVGGAVGTLPQYRYLQQLAVLAPLLMLGGLTLPFRLACRPGVRQLELVWTPVFLATLLAMSVHHGPLGHSLMKDPPNRERKILQPLNDLMYLRKVIQPGEGILDLTAFRVAHYMFYGTRNPIASGYYYSAGGEFGALAGGSPWKRRWIVQECNGDGGRDVPPNLRWLSATLDSHPERFIRTTPCLLQDLQPSQPLRLLPPAGEGATPPASSPQPGAVYPR